MAQSLNKKNHEWTKRNLKKKNNKDLEQRRIFRIEAIDDDIILIVPLYSLPKIAYAFFFNTLNVSNEKKIVSLQNNRICTVTTTINRDDQTIICLNESKKKLKTFCYASINPKNSYNMTQFTKKDDIDLTISNDTDNLFKKNKSIIYYHQDSKKLFLLQFEYCDDLIRMLKFNKTTNTFEAYSDDTNNPLKYSFNDKKIANTRIYKYSSSSKRLIIIITKYDLVVLHIGNNSISPFILWSHRRAPKFSGLYIGSSSFVYHHLSKQIIYALPNGHIGILRILQLPQKVIRLEVGYSSAPLPKSTTNTLFQLAIREYSPFKIELLVSGFSRMYAGRYLIPLVLKRLCGMYVGLISKCHIMDNIDGTHWMIDLDKILFSN